MTVRIAIGMLSAPSHPKVDVIRFFQHPIPTRQQHALRLACPKGDGTGFPRFAQLILWMT